MALTRPELFVPEYPTLYPSMLLARRGRPNWVPFNADRVHWFYFARNAVWSAVGMLGLAGGEVLVPSYHHGVEVEALVAAGARPVFYRVGRKWEVDLEDVERRIGPATRALYVIHYAGFPAPAHELKRLAGRHGLPLIEDCALSLLSSDGEQPLGVVGELGIYCLYKTLPVPNGGALMINDARLADPPPLQPPPSASTFSHAISSLLNNIELRGGAAGRRARAVVRTLGRGAVKAGQIQRVATGTMHFNPDHVTMGMSPLALRIAAAQDMPWIVAARRRNYLYLLEQLRDLRPPLHETLAPGICPLFYPLAVDNKPELLARLNQAGIQAINFWGEGHPACDPAEFPDTAWLRNSILELPCHQDLDSRAMQKIARITRDLLLESRPRAVAQPRSTHAAAPSEPTH